jgi:hypothetical protein
MEICGKTCSASCTPVGQFIIKLPIPKNYVEIWNDIPGKGKTRLPALLLYVGFQFIIRLALLSLT